MKANEQTLEKIGRAIKKTACHFSCTQETAPATDIFLQVIQESGEIRVYDDQEEELHRCVVDEWIENSDENFYTEIQPILKRVLHAQAEVLTQMHVLRPFSVVLIDDNREPLAELYLVDDDLAILDGELMQGLDSELEDFLKHLLQD